MNNGHTAWAEALEATRFGWPLILVQGSGDLANEIIYAKLTGQSYDFNVREIVGSGKAVVFNSGCSEAELSTLIDLFFSPLSSVSSPPPFGMVNEGIIQLQIHELRPFYVVRNELQ